MGDVRRFETRHGPIMGFAGDQYISRSLELYGEYSPAEARLLTQAVDPGMTVVEVGANIGALTVPLARACAPGPLYAFEPQQRVFQLLCANLALNDIGNVLAYPDACGAQPGRGAMPPLDYGASVSNLGAAAVGPADAPGQPVRIVTLDSLDLPACHLLKVDVEGHETDVLRGAAHTIRRHRPLLYVENDRPEQQQEVIDMIDALGYRMYWHVAPLFSASNFRGDPVDVFGRAGALNLFCLPAEGDHAVGNALPLDPRNWTSPLRPAGSAP